MNFGAIFLTIFAIGTSTVIPMDYYGAPNIFETWVKRGYSLPRPQVAGPRWYKWTHAPVERRSKRHKLNEVSDDELFEIVSALINAPTAAENTDMFTYY